MVTWRAVQLNLKAWKTLEEGPQRGLFLHQEHGVLLALMAFPGPPQIPPLSDLNALRDRVRADNLSSGQGIVSVDVVDLQGIPCLRSITKAPQEPTGMTYAGMISPLLREFSLGIRVECPEHGMTGGRESVVMLTAMPNPEIGPGGRMLGWMKDPYDPAHDESALYTLADDPRHDAMFPAHPLSRCRRLLGWIERSVRFDKAVLSARRFGE